MNHLICRIVESTIQRTVITDGRNDNYVVGAHFPHLLHEWPVHEIGTANGQVQHVHPQVDGVVEGIQKPAGKILVCSAK